MPDRPACIVLRAVAACTLVFLCVNDSFAVITSVGDVSAALPPGGGNVATLIIGNDAAGQVTIDGGTALTGSSATLGQQRDGVGSMIITGFGSAWDVSGAMRVGSAGAGRIQVLAGARLENGASTVGEGGQGTVTVDGFGSIWNNTSTTTVGLDGTGEIVIANGGNVFSTTSILGDNAFGRGTATISGLQSRWRSSSTLTVGLAGHGRLEITDGAHAESRNSSIVADDAASHGVVIVRGAGSKWDNASGLTIADNGVASVLIAEGAELRNDSSTLTTVANESTAEAYVEITGANSIWENSGDVTVGDAGFGVVQVLDGGRVESGDVVLGEQLDSYGKIVVDGIGSVWEITGQLDIGDTSSPTSIGEGEAIVANGGVISVNSSSTSAFGIGILGRLILDEGRLIATSSTAGLVSDGLIQGGGVIDAPVTSTAGAEVRTASGDHLRMTGDFTTSGLVDQRGGTLEVAGRLANTGPIALQSGAALRAQGLNATGASLVNSSGGQIAVTGGTVDLYATLENAAGAEIVVGGQSLAVFHDDVTNNGDLFVMPGSRALMLNDLTFGTTSVTTLVLSSSVEDAGGPHVDVGGTAALDGSLTVLLDDSYDPAVGDAFQVLAAAAAVSGTFSAPSLPALQSGLAWLLDYQPTSVTLSVIADQAADFNRDGAVDGTDLAAWESGFGAGPGAGQAMGDANGDGFVTGSDFLAWQRAFLPPAVPVGSPAPEPTAWAAAIVLLTGAAALRFRVG